MGQPCSGLEQKRNLTSSLNLGFPFPDCCRDAELALKLNAASEAAYAPFFAKAKAGEISRGEAARLGAAASMDACASLYPRPNAGSDASSPDSCGFNTPFHGLSLAALPAAQPEEMAGLAKALDDIWSLSSPEEGGAASVSPASSPVAPAAAAAATAMTAAAKRSGVAAAMHPNSVWVARARAAERARTLGSARPVEASPKTIP